MQEEAHVDMSNEGHHRAFDIGAKSQMHNNTKIDSYEGMRLKEFNISKFWFIEDHGTQTISHSHIEPKLPPGFFVAGNFKSNLKEGIAAIYFQDDGWFEGYWVAGRIEGYGEYEDGNGGGYKGLWKEDLQWGLGEEFKPGQYQYRGDFVAGEGMAKAHYY